jgi:hypothetical protein
MKLSDLGATFQTCQSLEVLAMNGPGNPFKRCKKTLYTRILAHNAVEYDPMSSAVNVAACAAPSEVEARKARYVKIGEVADNIRS